MIPATPGPEFRPEFLRNLNLATVLIMADNKTTESWATKGCKQSLAGRALGKIQCALMINNPVGLDAAYIKY